MSTTKIYIVYYSLYGHVEMMAREVQRGANSVQGVEATLWQVPETLSSVIMQKMKAPSKADDVPIIQPELLLEADGFIFGFPSRFGVMAAQFKAFFDATDKLWASQALAGKPAGVFWSTGFHGGGQELTAPIHNIWKLIFDGLNLHNFAKMALLEEALQITDPYLVCGAAEVDNNRNPNHFRLKRDKIQGCLISVFKVGIACSAESLKDRLDISDAVKGLRSIRDELIKDLHKTGTTIHEIWYPLLL